MDVIEINDNEEEFRGKKQGQNIPRTRRYAVVLPLFTRFQAIPIPFLMDTGAPEFVYLCSAAIHKLGVLGAIKEIAGPYPYKLLGSLGPEDNGVDQPYII